MLIALGIQNKLVQGCGEGVQLAGGEPIDPKEWQ
jgi:hypothetical protein